MKLNQLLKEITINNPEKAVFKLHKFNDMSLEDFYTVIEFINYNRFTCDLPRNSGTAEMNIQEAYEVVPGIPDEYGGARGLMVLIMKFSEDKGYDTSVEVLEEKDIKHKILFKDNDKKKRIIHFNLKEAINKGIIFLYDGQKIY